MTLEKIEEPNLQEEDESGEGDNGTWYVIQPQDEDETYPTSISDNIEPITGVRNCIVDASTGNIVFLKGSGDEDVDADSTNFILPCSTEGISWLRELENGGYALETIPSTEQVTFHAVEEDDRSEASESLARSGIVNAQEKESTQTSILHVESFATRPSHSHCIAPTSHAPRKVYLWSQQKINDLLTCIRNRENKIRDRTKNRQTIWRDISNEMLKLGHQHCDKDECFKKWSNLFRTWKIVRQRSRASRVNWGYYGRVSQIVKSLYCSNPKPQGKSTASASTKSPNPFEEILIKIMKNNETHQKLIQDAEDRFQMEVKKLDQERNGLLADIKTKLHSQAKRSLYDPVTSDLYHDHVRKYVGAEASEITLL